MQYLDLSIANPSFNHRSRRSGWLLANAPVSHIKLRSAPRALDALGIDERVHLTIDVNRGTGQFAACERVGIRRDVKFRHRMSKTLASDYSRVQLRSRMLTLEALSARRKRVD